jgi:hypothetical protein
VRAVVPEHSEGHSKASVSNYARPEGATYKGALAYQKKKTFL